MFYIMNKAGLLIYCLIQIYAMNEMHAMLWMSFILWIYIKHISFFQTQHIYAIALNIYYFFNTREMFQ